jgi:hypothetical protein
MDMDRLIVLDRGVIVADGSHAELLLQGGLYAELWRKQSGGFNPVARAEETQISTTAPSARPAADHDEIGGIRAQG